jgi:NADH-quinone oxidoreductase subunit L
LIDILTIFSLLVLSLPLGTFGILYFFGNKLPRKGDWLATGIAGVCLILASYIFYKSWNGTESHSTFNWFVIPGLLKNNPFTISILINPLSSLMMVVVTLISFLVHVYSIEYMFDKKNYTRYFPYLGLFTSSMIGIVLSDNLLVTFMCWELVGFASYLLIGFWVEKMAAARAAKKAFLVNRIGDLGFLLGICIIYSQFGTFDLSSINGSVHHLPSSDNFLFTIASLGIFMGCVGKSAQFPLQLWLPDAMEGPTPASALIHAATMVAAGIYLLAKTYFLLSQNALIVIAFVGAVTTVCGALPAAVQTDIKKVLAYSTISQLGFMVMAMGIKAYDAALFHLITHAFFKACLFLTAGAVIHEMHHIKQLMFLRGYFINFDTLNMKLMGGLRKKMPVTFVTYFISCMALIGVPFFSGFLSKDLILEGAFNWAINMQEQTGNYIYYFIPVVSVFSIAITAYYMLRQMTLVFFGSFKLKAFYLQAGAAYEKIHDPGWFMKIPMIVLATLSVWFFFSINPLNGHHGWLMEKLYRNGVEMEISSLWIVLISIVSISIGGTIAWWRFRPAAYIIKLDSDNFGFKNFLKNNWYMDKVYQYTIVNTGIKISYWTSSFDLKIIDGIVHLVAYISVIGAYLVALIDRYIVDGIVNMGGWMAIKIGKFSRTFQQGEIQKYFAYTLVCIVAILVWLLFN